MRAQVGDWLVVHSHNDSVHSRRAEIIAVPSPDGEPPYTVRWEDGHEGVLYPGPDAQLMHTQ
jgi:Domain of unknown function (DUF1918)